MQEGIRVDRRVALVTGASSGVGFETSSLLAARGYRTFGTSREPENSPRPKGVEMLKLDVRFDDNARAVVDDIHQREGRLDILINNAGFGLFGGIEETSLEEAREQFETALEQPMAFELPHAGEAGYKAAAKGEPMVRSSAGSPACFRPASPEGAQ